MNRQAEICGGMAAGAGLMYLFDPDQGRSRRALLRDKTSSLFSRCGGLCSKAARDLSNRAQGMMESARALAGGGNEPVENEVLEARVRSKIGRVVSHPGSIEVSADCGVIEVRGPILAREAARCLTAIRAVPGVVKVQDRLDLHENAGDIPGLQGHSTRTGQRANWTPAGRALASAAGSALTIYGLSTRGLAGSATGLLGAGLLVRAIAGMNLKRLTGVGAGPRAVEVRKTLNINAPVQEVFRLWTDYENFPRFMSHIREVRDHGHGRSYWVAEGPAGSSVSWDAEITGFEPDRMLAWKSVPGSMVENSGIVRFEATSNGACRIHLRISYNPPAGAAGHALAWMFGRDLKTQLDEDLVRLKSLIEDGKTRSGAGAVSRSELESGSYPRTGGRQFSYF